MSALWPFLVLGIFSGSVYGLAAMGVVLTYKTAGVFNFAYGAVAMFCAYTYWQLHDAWHLPAPVALPLLLLVVAPLLGLLLERLFSPLAGLSAEVQIVASLAVLAALEALAPILFGTQDRALRDIFPRSTVLVGNRLHVGEDQLAMLLITLASGAALWWLLRRTRFGTATRAVVDNRDLAGMIGVNGARIRRAAWVVSSIFAALVGILLSPSQGLDVYQLTVVVIYAFAPAVLGRLVSLPWAYGGGVLLGVTQSVLSKWGASGSVADVEAALPYLALLLLLVFMGRGLKEAGTTVRPVASGSGSPAPTTRRLLDRRVALGTGALVAAAAVPLVVSGPRLHDVTAGAVYALIALTLVVLSGWAGQISLAQFSFAGVGAFTAAHLAGSGGRHFLLAALVGMALAVPLGLVVGFLSLRLSGLFLALVTMAFALLMDNLVFNRSDVSGGLTGVTVPRPEILGLSLAGRVGFYELVVAVLGTVGLGALLLFRGPVGRRLQILRDSPLAASTLGVNLTTTKLVTFVVCGAVAALGGSLYGALQQSVTPQDFSFAASLELLLLVVLGGRSLVSGAVLAGAAYGVQLLPIPAGVARFIPLGIALGVLSLIQEPEGTLAQVRRETRRCLSVLRRLPGPPPAALPLQLAEGVSGGA